MTRQYTLGMTSSNATPKSATHTQTESKKPASTTTATTAATAQAMTLPAPSARARAHSASNQNGATRRPHLGHRNFGYICCPLTFEGQRPPEAVRWNDA